MTLGDCHRAIRKSNRGSQMTSEQIEFLEPMMAVYAAMVDRLDQNVGRLLEYLESEMRIRQYLDRFLFRQRSLSLPTAQTPGVAPGPADSDIAYDARWANMCNTPLRLYKQYAHEGGTPTPMIAHWPAGIPIKADCGSFPSHLVDLMPTVVELAGAEYPEHIRRRTYPSHGGRIVGPGFAQDQTRDEPIFWEFCGNHAIRDGHWKLVAERSKDWELYDLSTDRSETNDLVAVHPEKVKQLAEAYDRWAQRTGAKTHAKSMASKPSTQSQLFDLP